MPPLVLRAAAALTGIVVGAATAAADDGQSANGILHEVKGGVLAHDVPDLWSGTDLEHGVAINGELSFTPSLDLPWGTIRPAVGASVATNGHTSYAYADAHWEFAGPAGTFFSIGVGAAVHDGKLEPTSARDKALGSRVLFHVPLEAGIEFAEHYRVSLYFEHVSNGYLASPNEGLDNLGVRLGYRF
jgi:hypothetical protein